jgi:TolB-like protein
MKKYIWILAVVLLAPEFLSAQNSPRLVPRNDFSAQPVLGESAIIIENRNGKAMAIYIDGKTVAHIDARSKEKVIIPDGSHLIDAVEIEYDRRNQEWEYDERTNNITLNLTSNQVTMVITYLGPRLRVQKTEHLTLAEARVNTRAAALVNGAARTSGSTGTGGQVSSLETALLNATRLLVEELPNQSTVAIISVSSESREEAEYVVEELAYILVESRNFKVVDRRSLDAIRNEQKFQLSGEIDDNSAVGIGKMLGAGIVITGSISGSDALKRLRLKALDVKTAEIISMTSERF